MARILPIDSIIEKITCNEFDKVTEHEKEMIIQALAVNNKTTIALDYFAMVRAGSKETTAKHWVREKYDVSRPTVERAIMTFSKK